MISIAAKIFIVITLLNSGLGSAPTDKIMHFVASIYLDGSGSNATTVDEMKKMRGQLEKIDPNARVTWAMSNSFVFDEANRPGLAYVKQMVEDHHDEISIGMGFPNNNITFEQFKDKVSEWLYMYRYNAFPELHVHGTMGQHSVFESIPDQYKPVSFTSYSINPEQANWISQEYGVNAFLGWTATQTNVDQLTGEGSPLMPYYAHKDNVLVPAQDAAANSGNVFLNTITVDPVGSTYTSGESRWTIHPADPLTGGNSQLETLKQYLNNPYRDRNTKNYLSLFIDINWMLRDAKLSAAWDNIVNNFPGKVSVEGVKQFAENWKTTAGNDNSNAEFTLRFKGTGYTVNGYTSNASINYIWTETMTERIILKRVDGDATWKVVDFTDYTKPVPKLPYTTLGKDEDVSYITGRNFKFSPDAPLSKAEKARVMYRVSEIQLTEPITFD